MTLKGCKHLRKIEREIKQEAFISASELIAQAGPSEGMGMVGLRGDPFPHPPSVESLVFILSDLHMVIKR